MSKESKSQTISKVINSINILIIENSKTINKIISLELDNLNFNCSSAYTLKDAQKLIKKNSYDYIILDLHLPDGEGLDILNKFSTLKDTKIIVLTSSLDNDLRSHLFEYGILDYLNKEKKLRKNIKDINKIIQNVEKNKDTSILIIDDSFLVRTKISNILSSRNYKVHLAKDGKSSYEILKKEKVDLVILDLELPDIQGLKLLKNIKNNINEELPVFILSGNTNPNIYRDCIKNEATDFIKKPFISEELILKIDKNISFHRKNNELYEKQRLLEQYKNTVDINNIVSKTDKKGIITYVNKGFEEISGYKEKEVLGKHYSITTHPDMSSSFLKKRLKTVTINKKPWFGKVKGITKKGNNYYVNTVINPILDKDGNILEFIAIRNDITKIEKTKNRYKKRYSITADKFDEVIAISKLYEYAIERSNIILRVSLDKKITYANDLFYKVSGYTKKELLEKPYSIIKHPDYKKESIDNIFNTVDKGNIWKGTIKNISKTNKPFYSIATVVPIKNKDGEILEYMEIRQDITEVITLHEELEDTQREVIYKMGEIGERRSEETGYHVKRVAEYSKLLAVKAGLKEKEAEILKQASPMHDIGKVGIADSILNKKGKLTKEEFEKMKEHVLIGYEMLKNSNRPILKASAIVAHEHHEKYDGTGYPRGIKGNEIHIYGRITAICDVFDALGSDRPYKKAWDLKEILKLFKKERGKHFDPFLIDIFFKNLDGFLKIRDEISETNNNIEEINV
jgi:PAS domain S-box-containing protein